MGGGSSIQNTTGKDIDELRREYIESFKEEWAKFYSFKYPKMKGEEWYNKVKTGDILLFKCMEVSSAYYKEKQGSLYSHGKKFTSINLYIHLFLLFRLFF